jgi:hypothetical protein
MELKILTTAMRDAQIDFFFYSERLAGLERRLEKACFILGLAHSPPKP